MPLCLANKNVVNNCVIFDMTMSETGKNSFSFWIRQIKVIGKCDYIERMKTKMIVKEWALGDLKGKIDGVFDDLKCWWEEREKFGLICL